MLLLLDLIGISSLEISHQVAEIQCVILLNTESTVSSFTIEFYLDGQEKLESLWRSAKLV